MRHLLRAYKVFFSIYRNEKDAKREREREREVKTNTEIAWYILLYI